MNTRERAGIREIELQRDFALSRAAEYAGELAECKEQLAAAVKTIEELSTRHEKLQVQLIERNQQLIEARVQLPEPVSFKVEAEEILSERPAIQDDRN